MNFHLESLAVSWSGWILAVSWQVAIIFALVALIARTIKGRSAKLRYALWLLVLVKLCIPPSLSLPWSVGCWADAPGAWMKFPQSGQDELPGASVNEAITEPLGAAPLVASETNTLGQVSPDADREATRATPVAQPQPIHTSTHAPTRQRAVSLPIAALLTWMSGIILFACAVALRMRRLGQSIREGTEISEGPLRIELELLATEMNLAVSPDLIVSDRVTSPLLCGLLRPTIILPSSAVESLSAQELRMILMHELIHLKNRDLWIGWLQMAAQAVFWFHPIVWLANAQIRHERECACDEEAVERLDGKPARAYAETIVKTLLASGGRSDAGLAQPGIFERSARLQHRLESILDDRRSRRTSTAGWGVVAAASLAALTFASGNPGSTGKTLSVAAADPAANAQAPKSDGEVSAKELQALLDGAKKGDTIELEAKTYKGPIRIKTPVHLRGRAMGFTTLELIADEPLVVIDGKDTLPETVILSRMTIRWAPANPKTRMEQPAAVAVRDALVELRECRLESAGDPGAAPYGFTVAGSKAKGSFYQSQSFGFQYALFYTEGATGWVQESALTDAVHSVVTAQDGCKLEIHRCYLAHCGYHAVRLTGATAEIKNNVIASNNRSGIYLGNKSAHGLIKENLFIGNSGDIWSYAQSDAMIERNTFIGPSQAAVSFWDTCKLTLKQNSFVGHDAALIRYLKSPGPGKGATAEENHYWNNKKDTVDFEKGPKSIEGDPQFADPAKLYFMPAKGTALVRTDGSLIAGLSDPKDIQGIIAMNFDVFNARPPAISEKASAAEKPASETTASPTATPSAKTESAAQTPAQAVTNEKPEDLQSRIDRAQPGEVIELAAGTHKGPIKISKPLTIAGAGMTQTVLELVADEPAMMIKNADGVVVRDLTVRWANVKKMTSIPFGIPPAVAVVTSRADFLRCRIETANNSERVPYGLMAHVKSEISFTSGEIWKFKTALVLDESTKGRIESSSFVDAGHAEIEINGGSSAAINRCYIAHADVGVRVDGSTIEMKNNIIATISGWALYLGNDSAHGIIAENLFTMNGVALRGMAKSDAVIENNIFTGSSKAAMEYESSCKLAVRRNSFLENSVAKELTSRSEGYGAFFELNHYWPNGDRRSEVAEPTAIVGDPLFTDPANFDYTPGAGSPLLDAEGKIIAGLHEPKAVQEVLEALSESFTRRPPVPLVGMLNVRRTGTPAPARTPVNVPGTVPADAPPGAKPVAPVAPNVPGK